MKKEDLDRVFERFDRLESKMDELRVVDLPNLKIEVALIKERTNRSARIITGVGGLVTLAVSSAIAYMKRS